MSEVRYAVISSAATVGGKMKEAYVWPSKADALTHAGQLAESNKKEVLVYEMKPITRVRVGSVVFEDFQQSPTPEAKPKPPAKATSAKTTRKK